MCLPPANVEQTLSDVEKALKDWYFCFKSWAIAHYFLGISSTICAVLTASNPEIAGQKILLGYVAVTTAIITFLKAQQKNNAYIIAWRNLRAKRMAYYASDATLKDLVQCYKDGEDLIGKCD